MSEPADSILVAYATKAGSTAEVAETVGAVLRGHGLRVDVRPAAEVESLDGHDAVVLGAAIYVGRLHPDARHFLKQRREELAARPFAVFAMGPRTLEPADVEGSRQQLDRALGGTPALEPVATAIFGGVLDPAKLRFPLNKIHASDARDWDAIHAWADELGSRLEQSGRETVAG